MTGNVLEWTADWYDSNYYAKSPVENPTGPNDGSSKVLRGGSWSSTDINVRAPYRSSNDPASQYYNIGFRCGRSAPE
jgi:formylglycine-generating enzyme required for sulfatase activity